MSEFKTGDRVSYKGFEGTVIRQVHDMFEVRLDINEGRYLYADEFEPLKTHEGCSFCNHGQPLNDTANSDFSMVVRHDENDYYILAEYEGDDWNDNTCGIIQYCPKCGRKLEVAE